ncbi:MAG: radical SAM protein [Candidatus Omnitrophica bacterium]|nr:radical SAM protein [Candidatus Omnitrophota bacterium]
MKTINKLGRKLREKVLRKPTQVVLEPTNKCNLNCPYCMVGMQNEFKGAASHSLMSRPQGFMSEEVFLTVLSNLKEFSIKKVYLHFQGEPFLNSLTPKFAGILKQNKFEVGIFTNGMAFNDNNISEISAAGIDLIRFSVDGASVASYEKNRVGGSFDKVCENMRKIVLAHKDKKTRIEWQFLALKNNEHEVEKAREMAQKIGIDFFVKGFRETDPDLRPVNKEYRAKFLKKPCKDIYHQIGIYWNADVVPCCYDVDGKEIMGNLLKNSLKEIWGNQKYRVFRRQVDKAVSNPQDEPAICKTCLRWK